MPVAAIVTLVESLIQSAPGAIVAFRTLFANDAPTPADWDALRAKLVLKQYSDYVPESAIPKT